MKTLDKIKTLLGHVEDRPVPKGCTPISQFDAQDIFIAGYPKSGNTWFQDLICATVYGVIPEYCPPHLTQELVPDVHFKEFYQRYRTPMFFKTHHLPQPEYKRVVYLLRDGRDVMVSYFHHTCALEGRALDFLQLMKDDALFPSPWHKHVEAWRENPYGASILTIKYEDLKANTPRELMRFCAFAGLERDEKFLAEMAGSTSFDKMRQKEAREKIYLHSAWPKEKMFRRRGAVGSYKDEMPPEVLQAFLDTSADALRKCGYLD